jgi:DNA polymerase (family 10)
MRNAEIAAVFTELADRLALTDAKPFRYLAYTRAAELFAHLPQSVQLLSERGQLGELDGVGPAIVEKVEQLLATGTFPALERARADVDDTLLALTRLPGVGPATARKIHATIDGESFEALAERAKLGEVEVGGGLTKKVIDALVAHGAEGAVDVANSGVPVDEAGVPLPGPWILRDTAQALQEAVAELLEGIGDDPAASGAFVRGCELLRGVTVVATVDELEGAATALVERAEDAGWVRGDDGPLVPEPEPGMERLSATVALVAPTGIPAHVVLATEEQRNRAESQAAGPTAWLPLSLSADHAAVPYELRERVLAGLDPELIPTDLVTAADLRGELHAHSDWSDGRATILEMAHGARDRGDEWFVVTDHSAPYAMVGGLDDARLLAQADEVAAVNETLAREAADGAPPFRVLHGTEVEILADGRLGLADSTLARLDWVVASIHVSQKQSAEQLIERMRLVAENPLVDSIGHPTSRRLLRRHRIGGRAQPRAGDQRQPRPPRPRLRAGRAGAVARRAPHRQHRRPPRRHARLPRPRRRRRPPRRSARLRRRQLPRRRRAAGRAPTQSLRSVLLLWGSAPSGCAGVVSSPAVISNPLSTNGHARSGPARKFP